MLMFIKKLFKIRSRLDLTFINLSLATELLINGTHFLVAVLTAL